MDFNAIIKRVIAILTKPKDEFEVIKNEEMSVGDMYMKYALIVAAIPVVARFLGFLLFGRGFFGTGRILFWMILQYAASLAAVYILAMVIDALAPSFGAQKDMNRSMKVAVFSSTAAWVAGAFEIIPRLRILALIGGFYSLYLLFISMKSLKEPPEEKAAGYTIVSIIAYIAVFLITSWIAATIIFGSRLGWYITTAY